MLSEKLAQLRKEKNLTKKDVAIHLQIEQSTYGKYELGKRKPDYEMLLKLADFFGVSVDYLLGRSDFRNSGSPGEDRKDSFYSLDVSSLSEEAILQVKEYISFVRQKYGSTETATKRK